MKLENKRVPITGGGSGIGLELARRLADANEVVIAGRTTTKLEAARGGNPTIRVVQLDVTSERSAASMMAWLQSNLGGLDVLVNNAGVMLGGALSAPDTARTVDEEVEVNLGGAISMTRLALPLLASAPQAAIVFVSPGAVRDVGAGRRGAAARRRHRLVRRPRRRQGAGIHRRRGDRRRSRAR